MVFRNAPALLLFVFWPFVVAAAERPSTPAARAISVIRADVFAALKAEASTRKTGDNTPQVLRLIDLYCEMAAHPQRDKSEVLNDLGQQVRLRLETDREHILHKISAHKPGTTLAAQPSPIAIAVKPPVLAQQLAQQAAPAAAAGQGVIVTGLPGNVTQPRDYGPDLVALIQATVSPGVWKISGGKSAIAYFAPRQALVVSAPEEIHGQISGVLQQLHKAQQEQDGAQVVANVQANRAKQ